jgi:hypothetical protein
MKKNELLFAVEITLALSHILPEFKGLADCYWKEITSRMLVSVTLSTSNTTIKNTIKIPQMNRTVDKDSIFYKEGLKGLVCSSDGMWCL